MSTTPPPSFTPLPATPDRTDRATFSARMQAWFNAIPTFGSQIAALAANAYANAVDCYYNAVAAAASAVAALASQVAAATSAATASSALAAPLWVSGTGYTVGISVVRSPINGLAYTRLTNGNGTTDPSLDATNWKAVAYPAATVVRVTGTSVTMQTQCIYELANVAATNALLPPSPAANDIVWVLPLNGLYTNTVGRNGSKIYGQTDDIQLDAMPGLLVGFRYVDSTFGWRAF